MKFVNCVNKEKKPCEYIQDTECPRHGILPRHGISKTLNIQDTEYFQDTELWSSK